MLLGCVQTRIKAPHLSLYNNMHVPAVPFLWGVSVCAAGGSKVGPGEEPGALGSDGGFGGRCCVLLRLNSCAMGMVQPTSRGAAGTGICLWGLTERSGWEEWGQRSRGGGLCCPWRGARVFLVLLDWQEGPGETLWCFTVSFTGSHAPLGRTLAALLALGVQRTQVLGHWLGYGDII